MKGVNTLIAKYNKKQQKQKDEISSRKHIVVLGTTILSDTNNTAQQHITIIKDPKSKYDPK